MKGKSLIVIGGVALLLFGPLLFAVFTSKAKKAAPVTATQPKAGKLYLQTKQDILDKYGTPTGRFATSQFQGGENLHFKVDGMQVQAELFGEECHYLTYNLFHAWTPEQITAALVRNGTEWTECTPFGERVIGSHTFQSAEGHKAQVFSTGMFQIWSGKLLRVKALQEAERQAHRRKIPIF